MGTSMYGFMKQHKDELAPLPRYCLAQLEIKQ